jgi:hypothetical protein
LRLKEIYQRSTESLILLLDEIDGDADFEDGGDDVAASQPTLKQAPSETI